MKKLSEKLKKSQAKKVSKAKRLTKEIKRVRWPKLKEVNNIYVKVIIFVLITALVLFGLAMAFGSIWEELGVGVYE